MKNTHIYPLLAIPLLLAALISGCAPLNASANVLNPNTLRAEWTVENYTRVAQAPVVLHSTIVIITANQQLIALDTRNGEEKWNLETPAVLWPGSLTATFDTIMLAGENGRVFALTYKRGVPEWDTQLSGEVLDAPLLDRYILFTVTSPATGSPEPAIVYALNAATGAVLWQFETQSAALTQAARGGDSLYVGSRAPGDARLYALSAAEGQLRWANATLEGSLLAITANADIVIVRNDAQQVSALNAANGEIQWQTTHDSALVWMQAADDVLWLADEDHLMAWNIGDATAQWQAILPQPLASAPILSEARIWALLANGDLQVYEASSGSLVATFHSGITAPAGMQLYGDQLFIVNTQGQVSTFTSRENNP